MANLNITEFSAGVSMIGTSQAQMLPQPFVASQNVAVGAGHLESAAFNAKTRVVRLFTDTACAVIFGDAPAAATTDMRLAANVFEYFAVQPGQKVSVIV